MLMNDRLTEQELQAMAERCEKPTFGLLAIERAIHQLRNYFGYSDVANAAQAELDRYRTDLPNCLREIGALGAENEQLKRTVERLQSELLSNHYDH